MTGPLHLPHVVVEATNDPDIKGAPFMVYMWLWGELEPHEFRPMRASYIAGRLLIGRDTALHALDVLVAQGYLAEGRRTVRGIRTFRLLTTRRKLEP